MFSHLELNLNLLVEMFLKIRGDDTALQVSASVSKYVAWGFNFIFCSTQFNIKYIVC